MQYIQYLDEGFLGESLVNLRSVGDVLGSVGIVQCGQGLLQIAGGWADCGNDGRLGPPTQRVLQNPGQLTLPIYMYVRIYMCTVLSSGKFRVVLYSMYIHMYMYIYIHVYTYMYIASMYMYMYFFSIFLLMWCKNPDKTTLLLHYIIVS